MYWTAQIYKVLHSWVLNCLIVIHCKNHISYCTTAQTRVWTHTWPLLVPPAPAPTTKISPDEIWPSTGSAQWYFLFYSVLSHFKGAGMTCQLTLWLTRGLWVSVQRTLPDIIHPLPLAISSVSPPVSASGPLARSLCVCCSLCLVWFSLFHLMAACLTSSDFCSDAH